MALAAQVIRALDRNLPHYCAQLFGTHFMKPRPMTARTGDFPFELHGRAEQPFQDCGSEMVGGAANRRLGRLQVEAAAFAQAGEDDVQERGYFLGRFAPDRFGSFFPPGSGDPRPGVPDRFSR